MSTEKKNNPNVGEAAKSVQGNVEREAVGTGNSLHLLLKRGPDIAGEFRIHRFPEGTDDPTQQLRDVLAIEKAIESLTGIRCHATLTVGELKPETRPEPETQA